MPPFDSAQASTAAARAASPPGSPWGWRKIFVPDLGFVLTAIMMFYCLTLFGGMQKFFRDADSGWHIRNGERILKTKEVPRVEPFSFSRPGGAWFAWEWLADVAMAKAHEWDGLRGVFSLYLAVLSLVSWLWFRLLWACEVWFLPAALASWVMLTTSTIHWLARPHLFGWLFLLWTVLLAERATERRAKGWWWAVALAGVVWANMHGSFFLGPAVLALYAGEAFLRKQEAAGRLLGWAGLMGVVSLVNPYGWNVHRHIGAYLQDKELLSRVGEFQTFNFNVDGAQALVAALLLAACGVALNWEQGRWARGVICLVLFVGALRSARGLPLVALVAVPLSLGAICRALADAQWGVRWARWREGFIRYNRNLRRLDTRYAGWGLAPIAFAALLALGHTPLLARSIGFSYASFPVALSEEIAKLPPEARIFSSDKFGGYLIYRFAGERKVFFDGRSDYYGAGFMKAYLKIPDAKPGWEAEWAKWNFTHALVAHDMSLSLWLAQKGWRKLGEDQAAILFAKEERN